MGDWYLSVLCRLLPEELRRTHGSEMEALLRGMKAEALKASRLALLRFYGSATWDVLLGRLGVGDSWEEPGTNAYRRGGWWDGLRQDVGYGMRSLRRAPLFTAVAVGTLALGIGATASVFSAVDAVLLRPLPYADPDRLVLIFNRYPALEVERAGQNPGDYVDYRQRTDVFERIGAFGGTSTQTLTGLGAAYRVPTSSVTDSVFPMLGVMPLLGRGFVPEDPYTNVLVSHGFWQSDLGGDPDVLGRTLRLDNVTVSVIGVLPPDFAFHTPAHLDLPAGIAVWYPIRRFLGTADEPDRSAHWMTVLAKLRPGVPVEAAQSQLDAVAEWQRATFTVRADREAQIDVVPLHDEIVQPVRPTLVGLLGAVAFVLLIACSNVANLLLARGNGRQREVAIRAAVGGHRSRLVRQMMTENSLLAIMGSTVGILLAGLGVKVILALRPHDLPLADGIAIDGRVLGFVLVSTVGTTLLFGLTTALHGSRVDLGAGLQIRGGIGDRGVSRVRSTLVVLEVGLSVTLLIGAGLMLRSVRGLDRVDVGFPTDGVLTAVAGLPRAVWDGEGGRATLNPAFQAFYQEAEESLRALPGVRSVGAVWPTPLDGSGNGYASFREEGVSGDESQLATSHLVTPGYLASMDIPVVLGRGLMMEDGPEHVVVDERMANTMWPGENPLGRRLTVDWWWGPTTSEVVGVVANVRTARVDEDDPPSLYRKAAVFSYSPLTFLIRTGVDPLEVVSSVRRTLQAIHPEVAVEHVRPLAELRDAQLTTTRFVASLIGAFAGVAGFLAWVGLYGVIAYLVGQKTREFGVRIALGARSADLVAPVARHALLLTGIGVVIGLCGAVAATRVISAHLYGVESTDPITLAGTAGLLAFAAFIACLRPSLRALGTDPVRALRAD